MAMTPYRDDSGSRNGNKESHGANSNGNSNDCKILGRSLFDGSIFNKPFELWDPFEHMNALWEDGPMRSMIPDVRAIAGTRVDWKETADVHVFKADLPGLNRDEVKLTVEDDRVLQITGERTQEKDEKTDKWHRVERSHGRFLRRFSLPENANVEKIHAKVEDGVLTVTVPKTDKGRKTVHRQIDIK
ncbi:hypothetical protein R1sor_009765 [Riccia sorocarpa]|uniref:SHSP domain-containing protein n=1 Tax=Riccia sorocarpa TaxID=122646 RepID=A0ABD3I254_9MARC